MQNILKTFAGIFCLVFVLASCKKEGGEFDLQQGKFGSTALTASKTSVILSQSNNDDTVVTFNWAGADFGKQPVVSYTLQLDVPSDTSNHWANAKNFSASSNDQHISFLGKELNDLLNQMGLAPDVSNNIVFRIKADVNQNNGSASSVASVYSNVVTVGITSFLTNLYIPGDYQGWNPGAAPIMAPVKGKPGLYEAYVYMEAPGQHYFKYTNAPDWNHTNYGDGGNGTFSTDGNAGGLSVADGGYYELTANLNSNTWTATKTTWGIIGDATPGGWGNDTQMTYDPATQMWTVTANMVANGSFKFRANNAWSIDFGIDGTGKLIYADSPFFGYTANLNNLSVPSDGNYTITLDLHVSGVYSYILHKN